MKRRWFLQLERSKEKLRERSCIWVGSERIAEWSSFLLRFHPTSFPPFKTQPIPQGLVWTLAYFYKTIPDATPEDVHIFFPFFEPEVTLYFSCSTCCIRSCITLVCVHRAWCHYTASSSQFPIPLLAPTLVCTIGPK